MEENKILQRRILCGPQPKRAGIPIIWIPVALQKSIKFLFLQLKLIPQYFFKHLL